MKKFKENFIDFCMMLYVLLIRVPYAWVMQKILVYVLPSVEQARQALLMAYWRFKFPYVSQMRKLVGAELAFHHGEITKIREKARLTFVDEVNMSNSQRKRHRAQVHNEDKKYFADNGLVIIGNALYKVKK